MCSVDLCGNVARREGYPCGLARQRGGLEPATPSEVLWESRTSSWPAAFEGSHGAATAWVERAAAAHVSNYRSRRSMSQHGLGGARVLACASPSRGSRSCLVAFPRTHEAALGQAPARRRRRSGRTGRTAFVKYSNVISHNRQDTSGGRGREGCFGGAAPSPRQRLKRPTRARIIQPPTPSTP